MGSFRVYRIAVGTQLPSQPSPEWVSLYHWLVRHTEQPGHEWTLVAMPETLAVSNTEAVEDRQRLAAELRRILDSWPDGLDVLLVDVFHPYRGAVPAQMLLQIGAALETCLTTPPPRLREAVGMSFYSCPSCTPTRSSSGT